MLRPLRQFLTPDRSFLRHMFWLLLFLNLLNHLLVYLFVNLQYIDADQFYMWHGAVDYSRGKFYEPRFYGQDYNTFIEAVPAVPLLWVGLPVYYALPAATHLLALLPLFIPAIYLYRKEQINEAVVVLALPLCLPLAYDIMTGIPRGFVGGLFFTAFYIFSMKNPHNLRLLAFNTAMAVCGYFVNPNSLLVSIPFLFYLFLYNYKRGSYYLASSIAIPAYVLLFFLLDYFYILHPDYVIYDLGLEFSTDNLLLNLTHIHSRLAHVAFLTDKHAWVLFAAYILFQIFLYRNNRKAFYAGLLVPLVASLSLASNKGSDGVVWPFYSYSRAYLGLPLFFALFYAVSSGTKTTYTALVVAAAILFSGYKLYTFRDKLHAQLDSSLWKGVHLLKLEFCLEAIDFYKNKCELHNAEQLMVSNHFWLNTLIAYGGPAVHDDFPACFETKNEHRYWMREGAKNKVVPRFIYLSPLPDLEERLTSKDFELEDLDNYGLYLVKNNKLSNSEFIGPVLRIEEDDPFGKK